ncbi:MAG: Maf family protein [Bacteroidota bacterium]
MNFKNPIILGSKSPRRRNLLKTITNNFESHSAEVNENYPHDLPVNQVASYLAQKKALAYKQFDTNHIVITSDTTVILDDQILGKPASFDDGYKMLKSLSGRSHGVNTAVSVRLGGKSEIISEFTEVHFPKLDDSLIEKYLNQFHPFDKAGAYGIQECVPDPKSYYNSDELLFLRDKGSTVEYTKPRRGTVFTIKQIEGSYFNVVGFPIVAVADVLKKFL